MNKKYTVTVCAAALMIFSASMVQAQDSQTMESQMKATSQVQTRQIQTPATIDNTPTPPATDLPVPTGQVTDANTVDLGAMSGGTTTAPVASATATAPAAPPPLPTPVLTTSNPQTMAANTRVGANASTADRITNIRDAVAVGILVNPQTEAVQNNRRATDEEYKQAKALWLPSIDWRGDAGWQYTSRKFDGTDDRQSDNGTTAQTSLTLTQMLFDGFNTKYENERQKWRVRSASHRVRETAEFLGLDIIESYIDILRQRELLAIAVENTRQHTDILGQISDATSAGRSTQADVEQTNARMAAAKATEANVRQALMDAETNYRRRVGDLPQPELERPVPPRELLEANVEEEVKKALTHSPTLDIYEADVNVADKEANQTNSTMYPEVDFQLSGNAGKDVDLVQGDEYGGSALVVANWNLYRGGGDIARQREFVYRHAQSKSERNNAARAIEADVRQTWSSMVSAGTRAEQFGRQADANGQVVAAYKDQFNLDRRTLLDVLDSQNEWFVSRTNAINNQYLEMFAVFRLLAVKGELLPTLQVAYPKEANPADTSTGTDSNNPMFFKNGPKGKAS